MLCIVNKKGPACASRTFFIDYEIKYYLGPKYSKFSIIVERCPGITLG
jgi:hypothetical protein